MARADREPRDRPRGALAPDAAPRLLHDRLGGARVERARRARAASRPTRRSSTTARAASTSRGPARPGRDGVWDVLLGMAAAADEPIAGGRHKVFGHHDLRRDPADVDDRLAPAAGRRGRVRDRARARARRRVRLAARRGRRLLVRRRLAQPRDRAGRAQHRGAPRVRRHRRSRCSSSARTTASGSASRRPRLGRAVAPRAPRARGRDARTATTRRELLATARELAAWVREHRHPAVLHLRTVRYLSHAGADLETAYRVRPGDPRRLRARPAARHRHAGSSPAGARTGEELAAEYLETRERVRERALDATRRPQLATADDVMRPLAPRAPAAVAVAGAGGRPTASTSALTLAQAINAALADVLERSPRDARLRRGRRRQGRRLRRHARPPGALRRRARVRHAARRDVDPRPRARHGGHGLRADPRDPVPRLPPQRRGPAARRGGDAAVLLAGRVPERDGRADRRATATRRASAGTSTTTTRLGVLRDIPGLVIASPARPDDAGRDAADVRRRGEGRRHASASSSSRSRCTTRATCTRRATGSGSPRPATSHVPIGSARTHRDGDDLTIVTWGNGLLHVAARRRVGCASAASARASSTSAGSRRCRSTDIAARGGGDAAACSSSTRRAAPAASGRASSPSCSTPGYDGRLARVSSKDSFIPLGDAAQPRAPLRGRDRGGGAASSGQLAPSARGATRAAAGRGRPPAPPRAAGAIQTRTPARPTTAEMIMISRTEAVFPGGRARKPTRVRYRDVALSDVATRLHIAMSEAVTTPAERTTCHDRSSQPSDFASTKSGTATASAMRKIWAARTGGCWLIARYPFMPASPSSGVGGVATTPGSRRAQLPNRRPRCGGASPLPSPLSTLARPSFPEQVARSRAHPSERCEVTPRTFTSGGLAPAMPRPTLCTSRSGGTHREPRGVR